MLVLFPDERQEGVLQDACDEKVGFHNPVKDEEFRGTSSTDSTPNVDLRWMFWLASFLRFSVFFPELQTANIF